MANKNKLVESLRELVNKARGLIDTVEETSSSSTTTPVTETLQSLYPSTNRKASSSATTTTTSSKRVIKGPFFQPSNKKSKKNPQLKESLKDFFFLLHGTCKVPRKNAREFYYENGLVASAISINSEMGEVQIREMIREQIPAIFERKPFTEFNFVKAVGESLVTPDKIVEWNYKTIKHIYGNGPVYVRATSPIEHFDYEYDYEESRKENVIPKKEQNASTSRQTCSIEKPAGVSNSNVRKFDNCDASQSTISVPSVSCPICYQRFSKEILEAHAAKCAEMKYDFIDYSSDELTDKEEDLTVPYNVEEPREIKALINERDVVLEKLINDQKTAKSEVFKCRRKYIWQDFIAHRKKPWSSASNNIKVTFLNESAVDTGGPRREFFSECLKYISRSILKDGVPIDSLLLVNQKEFKYVGEIMAMSLCQGGPNPTLLQDWCYQILSSKQSIGPTEFEPTVEFLGTTGVKEIAEAETDTQYQNALCSDNGFDLMAKIGYCGLPTKETLSNRTTMLQLMYYKVNVEPRLAALAQIADGLAVNGMIEIMRKNPQGFKDLFLSSNEDLSLELFFEELDPQFSDTGSNKYPSEESTFKMFCDFAEKCFYDDSSSFRVGDICKFITGSSSIPFQGFDSKIQVIFKHDCNEGCGCMPSASTCALSIELPIHNDTLERMTTSMERAMTEAPFFGRV